jgi:hypothetical protein
LPRGGLTIFRRLLELRASKVPSSHCKRCRSFLSRACSFQSISRCQYLRRAGLRIRLSEVRLRLLLPTRLLRLPCAAAILETLETPCPTPLEAGLVVARPAGEPMRKAPMTDNDIEATNTQYNEQTAFIRGCSSWLSVNMAPGSRSVGYHSAVRGPGHLPCTPACDPGPQTLVPAMLCRCGGSQ